MDYIIVRTTLPRSREVLAIATMLRVSRHEVVGALIEFWAWAQAETDTGVIVDACVDGHVDGAALHLCDALESHLNLPAQFLQSLTKLGWLNIKDNQITIPNFGRWMSHGAKSRLLRNSRQQRFRDRAKHPAENTNENVDECVTPKRHYSTVQYSHETSIEETNVSSAQNAPRSAPINGFFFAQKSGKVWSLPDTKHAEYTATYPDLDVGAELRKARQWLADHPARRPASSRGMAGFLTRWLNRAWDHRPLFREQNRLETGKQTYNPETGEIVAAME